MRSLPFLILIALAASFTACQGSSVTYFDGQTNQDEANGDHDHPADGDGHVHTGDEEGHGPDPDGEMEDFSPITGSWRAARAEDDAPLAYFDLFLYEDDPSGDGTFIMGLAPSEMLDGNRGDITDLKHQSGTLTISWNPTSQDEELYTIEGSLSDPTANELTATFSALQAPFSFEVTLSRMIFDEDDQ